MREFNDWEALIEWLETLEDIQIAREAFNELKTVGGDRERAGWLRWDEVKTADDLGREKASSDC